MNKPKVKINAFELNGNIFNLITLAKSALVNHGQEDNAKKLSESCIGSKSYEHALEIVKKYVDIV